MGFIKSLNDAFRGLMYVLRSERNARIHLLVAFAVLLLGLVFNVSGTELAALFFAIIMVFLAEIANTAFEKTLDLIQPEYSEKVRVVKDMAAGAVLVAAVGAVLIGVMVFYPYVLEQIWPG
jgi:diacylglycerol kinase